VKDEHHVNENEVKKKISYSIEILGKVHFDYRVLQIVFCNQVEPFLSSPTKKYELVK
jgi:hypothetical protein